MRTLLLLLGLSCFMVVGQLTPQELKIVDSLDKILNQTVHDTTKANTLRAIDKIAFQKDPERSFKLNYDLIDICNKNLKKLADTTLYNFWKKRLSWGSGSLGILYYNTGIYDSAIYYHSMALDIRLELDMKLRAAHAMNNLGMAHYMRGQSGKALQLYHRAKDIFEDLDLLNLVSISYNRIGVIDLMAARYEAAAENFTRSYQELKEIGDKEGWADGLYNLAVAHIYSGEMNRALSVLDESRKLRDELGDKRDIADVILATGLIYSDLGNFDAALKEYMKAEEIYKDLEFQSGISMCLNNIGGLYGKKREYAEAKNYYKASAEIERSIGNEEQYAGRINNYGAACLYLGDLDSAIHYCSEAHEILSKTTNQKSLANVENNLGEIHVYKQEFKTGIRYLLRANRLAMELNVSETQVESSWSLLNAYAKVDSMSNFLMIYNQVFEKRQNELKNNLTILSENEKGNYLETLDMDFDKFNFFALQEQQELPSLISSVYNLSLNSKGLMLKSSTLLKAIIYESEDSSLMKSYNEWLATKRKINRAYSEGRDISKMTVNADSLERLLVIRSQEFANLNDVTDMSWNRVKSQLKKDEAAIEFVRFTSSADYDYGGNSSELYAALMINRDSEYPKLIQLFEEPELEKIIGAFPGNNLSYIDQVYGTKENTKSQLYDLIWKPMEEELKGVKKVYVSPVGLLHKISFAALAKEQDVFLCDNYEIEMMSSTGKIALPTPDAMYEENRQISVFGGIDYNSDSTKTEIWNYLDGSLSETDQISKILKKRNCKYYNLSEASEAKFKEVASNSSIMHIATHGFFYADPDQVLQESVDQVESKENIVFRGGRTGVGMNTFVKSRNPLMRSGLAFAGANDVWNRTSIEGEDGVLTAAEVATIDMRDCDLVVLSACETGLGDIKGSEGVYGLQRSFKMAGVKYLIMSLWQVPDKETAEFMTSFYKNLTKTDDIKKSFNMTQQEMRQKYDPYYWGAFVLIE